MCDEFIGSTCLSDRQIPGQPARCPYQYGDINDLYRPAAFICSNSLFYKEQADAISKKNDLCVADLIFAECSRIAAKAFRSALLALR